jgi:predicted 3-demethylubiquinone-9 3-methyltransferase (glyoxalase superfamily)
MTKPIQPCIWFNDNAKEAVNFYTLLFPNSKIVADNGLVVNFELDGQLFMGLNGGAMFTPNPSISLFALCETETATDTLWNKLVDGGTIMMPLDKYDWSAKYGFLQDKFGVAWQIYLGKKENVSQTITPSLMFTQNYCGKAEAAIHFYTSLFNNSHIQGILKYALGDSDREDLVKHAQFKLNGYTMMAMDSSATHAFTFTEGISFVITCDTQEEIDYYWDKLTHNGTESMCGWLKDAFGVSWQVVPALLNTLMQDSQKSAKVVQAFMQMKKFNIEQLLEAAKA